MAPRLMDGGCTGSATWSSGWSEGRRSTGASPAATTSWPPAASPCPAPRDPDLAPRAEYSAAVTSSWWYTGHPTKSWAATRPKPVPAPRGSDVQDPGLPEHRDDRTMSALIAAYRKRKVGPFSTRGELVREERDVGVEGRHGRMHPRRCMPFSRERPRSGPDRPGPRWDSVAPSTSARPAGPFQAGC